MLRAIVVVLLMLVCPVGLLWAFDPRVHADQIREAFLAVPAASKYADPSSAVERSHRLDDDENRDEDQHLHSMRSRKTFLAVAQQRAATCRTIYMTAAVEAAKQGDTVMSGDYLGRLLHMVQDEKHLWCSCWHGSNPPDSDRACSTTAAGCQVPGEGHHGVPDCEWWRAIRPESRRNFQLRTEGGRLGFLGQPTSEQLSLARARSIDLLNEFVRRVQP